VLEGMAIAAYAVGAQKGFIYVRAEYPLAIKRLQTAIKQAERMGLLGNGIFESRFSFHIDMRIGAGAFVCGEETALIASIEGKRGTPRPRPPFPAESGAVGLPHADQQRRDLRQRPPIIATARSGSPPSARRRARAPRCSRWPARSTTPA
jgi:NADH:ubiquinone oxidoreductase subunit F (NADH-binding)